MAPPKISSSNQVHNSVTPPSTPANAPESTPAPQGRRRDGRWDAIKRTFAPRPVTVSSSVIGTRTRTRPTPARAKISVSEAQQHKADPNATTQPAVIRHGHNVALTVAGAAHGAPSAAASRVAAEANIVEAGGTEATAAKVFNQAGRDGAHELAADIAKDLRTFLGAGAGASEEAALEAAGSQELVLRRMEQAFGADAQLARNALDSVVAKDAPLNTENDGFELARRLATSRLGHATLCTLCNPERRPAPDSDPVVSAIRGDAERLAFRAANVLIDALPAGADRPANMEDVKRIALAALPPHERPHGAASNAPPAAMKGDVRLPAKALLAALQLAADPAAEPERHLKSAYFSWRCGFVEEGPGTPLAKTQHRLHKLSRYARRASDPGTLTALRRVFGFNKSPMSALAMGTGGASLRQPDEDFLKLKVVGEFAKVMVARARPESDAPPAERISDALKGATLEQWDAKIDRKGWRDKATVTGSMRRAIVARAAELSGASEAEIKQSPTYAALKPSRSLLHPRGRAQLTLATLREWIGQCVQPEHGEAGPDALAQVHPEAAALQAGLAQLATLEHNGEVALDTSTPQTVLENFKRVITEPRTTYDVRLADGGQVGINLSVTEILNLPIVSKLPFVIAGPDVKLIHGRHAMINGGSSANHGQLFIGSDRRTSGHLGVSATGGVNLFGKHLGASGTLQALPLMVDLSRPKGVMIRSRLQPLGTPPAGTQPAGERDPWRAKMLSVIDAATASGAGGGLPVDAGTMWEAMAHSFYKDPDISVNWLESRGTSVSSGASASIGARYQDDNYKIGPNGQASYSKNWFTRTRRQESAGPLRAEYISSSSSRQTGVAATLVAGFPPQGNFSDEAGHVKSVVLPSASIVGIGTTVLQSELGSTWRIAEEDGHIDPKFSFRDTTFTSFKEMKRYVDSRSASWENTLRNQPAGAPQPVIGEYLAAVEQDATRGTQVYAERSWLRPDAASKINVLRELRDALVAPGTVPDKATRAQIDERNTQIAALLESEHSWDNRFFYSLEINGDSRGVGVNFLVNALHTTEVSHPHQLSLLRAERPVPPAER